MCLNNLLNVLKSGYIYDIGVAADMFWIIISVNNQYAIDIQSPFRILFNDKIIFANTDVYLNEVEFKKKLGDCKTFIKLPCDIMDIYIENNNDLHIKLNNNISIETFTNSSVDDDEQWRIFERHNNVKPHYVAYYDRICKE